MKARRIAKEIVKVAIALNAQTLIKEMDKAIAKYKKDVEKWSKDEKDKSVIKTWNNDVADLETIRDYIKNGNMKMAAKLIGNLDTAVRDEIPSVVYKFVTSWDS